MDQVAAFQKESRETQGQILAGQNRTLAALLDQLDAVRQTQAANQAELSDKLSNIEANQGALLQGQGELRQGQAGIQQGQADISQQLDEVEA